MSEQETNKEEMTTSTPSEQGETIRSSENDSLASDEINSEIEAVSKEDEARANEHVDTEDNAFDEDGADPAESVTRQEDASLTPSAETSPSIEEFLQEMNTQLLSNNENLQAEFNELKAMQEKITADFNEKLKYDEHKEQLIDQLHKEVQAYKADILKSTITPIVNDLIMVSDNIQKLVGNYRSTEEPLNGEEILTHLESVTLDIDNVLFRQGIEPYQSLGEKVEPLKQTISKTVKTGDESQVKKIAERLRKGYEWDDKIIRKEHVSVYVYDETMSEESNEKEQEEGVEDNE